MIDTENQRKTIVKGLKSYLKIPIIRSNQSIDAPEYPYIVYTITTLANENKGTYAEWNDGKCRKPHIQTWSITAHSNDYAKAVEIANKAHDWLELVGTSYLNDNDVIVQSVGSVTDRSNLLTVDYDYSYGFDCFLWVYDVIDNPNDNDDVGYIESMTFNNE